MTSEEAILFFFSLFSDEYYHQKNVTLEITKTICNLHAEHGWTAEEINHHLLEGQQRLHNKIKEEFDPAYANYQWQP